MPKSYKLTSSGGSRDVTPPVAIGRVSAASRPVWVGCPDGIRIRHSELVGTLRYNSVNTFQVDDRCATTPGLDLNPANALLFPWLSVSARAFERYRFHSVRFELYPAQGTSTGGRCYAAVDLDYDDPVPTNAQQTMCNRYAVEGPVWSEFGLTVPGKELMRDMPWRWTSLVGRQSYIEPRTAMSGFLIVAAIGPTACAWDLRVSYDVELCAPTLEDVDTATTFIVGPDTTNWQVLPAYATSCVTAGTIARQVNETFQNRDCPLKQVQSGAGNTPLLQSAFFGASTGQVGWDTLPLMGRNALINIVEQFALDARTPQTDFTGGARPTPRLEFFNDQGVLLGSPTSSVAETHWGSGSATSWTVAGGIWSFAMAITYEAMKVLYPTFRYFVASITDGAGSGILANAGRRSGGLMIRA